MIFNIFIISPIQYFKKYLLFLYVTYLKNQNKSNNNTTLEHKQIQFNQNVK